MAAAAQGAPGEGVAGGLVTRAAPVSQPRVPGDHLSGGGPWDWRRAAGLAAKNRPGFVIAFRKASLAVMMTAAAHHGLAAREQRRKPVINSQPARIQHRGAYEDESGYAHGLTSPVHACSTSMAVS
jgi:hypothetical protein